MAYHAALQHPGLLHLSTTKSWFTTAHVRQLIEVFVEITGFRPHGV